MWQSTHKKNQGFTLIELMVVITIIGLLASTVLASLSTARQKARDAQRVQTVKELQKALELYRNANNGRYPCHSLNCVIDGSQGSSLSVNGTGAGVFPNSPNFDSAIAPYFTPSLEQINFSAGTTITQGSIAYRVGSSTNATNFDSYVILLRREQSVTNSTGQTIAPGAWCDIRVGPSPSLVNWADANYPNCY